jgi:DNA mismatch repair protein MutL
VIAKSLSIKSGKDLSILEQQALVDDLFACKETLLSPFDHQIFVTLDKEELENKLN